MEQSELNKKLYEIIKDADESGTSYKSAATSCEIICIQDKIYLLKNLKSFPGYWLSVAFHQSVEEEIHSLIGQLNSIKK